MGDGKRQLSHNNKGYFAQAKGAHASQGEINVDKPMSPSTPNQKEVVAKVNKLKKTPTPFQEGGGLIEVINRFTQVTNSKKTN